MRKWIFEFLSKSDSRDNKIARINSIRITKFMNLLKFHTGFGVLCNVDI